MKTTQPLRRDIKQLGSRLGRVMSECDSPELLQKVEEIRKCAKSFRSGSKASRERLTALLSSLGHEESYKIARAFTEFLRLANAAEQHHRIRRRRYYATHSKKPQDGSIEAFFKGLANKDKKKALDLLNHMEVELVLTAHPTEAMRQSAIRRYKHMAKNLEILDRPEITKWEKELAEISLDRNVRALWLTEVVQAKGPTPITEALGGFSIVEEVLWDTLPRYLRLVNYQARKYLGGDLQPNASPIRFSSWMGGDRDGNPYVTSGVTRQILLMGMAKAYHLIRTELDWLLKELSFNAASDELLAKAGGPGSVEPYRVILAPIFEQVREAEHHVAAQLRGINAPATWVPIGKAELLEPLHLCYESLIAIGARDLAEGRALDLIRRLEAFGVCLLGLDIRQASDAHESTVAEIFQHQGWGNYQQMSEAERQSALVNRLESSEGISLPKSWEFKLGEDVMATCRLLNEFPPECFRSYVVSMTEDPSDLLEVLFLFKAAGVKRQLPVVPLLETPEALAKSEEILSSLWSIKYYRSRAGSYQQVMLGYSDSSKRSGRLCSSWMLHQVQAKLDILANSLQVEFEYFHGRGGSIGRGGGPVHLALLALPRGSGQGRIRVTEQGESIHAKFGLPGIAERTMELYISGVLEAALSKPPKEKKNWMGLMDHLGLESEKAFRGLIYEDPKFLDFFAQVTPIQELSLLKIGSRPSKRKRDFSFDSLRAIPWIYSWTQNRGLLPSWLGLGEALEYGLANGHLQDLKAMYKSWPFFASTLSLFEMVLAKVDLPVFEYYTERLADENSKVLSQQAIESYYLACKNLARITGRKELLANNPVLRRSIDVRTPYVDVLNLMQAHFLKIYRDNPDDPWVQRILAITISGISAGMRNTG
ncbi:MAG: phosphoenolpyruvate carboxylase [Bdellovibrionaceae bacterium]|nr:phosphoenolpyruvate carboxylase [Bdellovibrionales bacterium]MCB9084433.1 phosphoenolpyruvate carboxylase [Pseudobdellovibrionaceae bacterium]